MLSAGMETKMLGGWLPSLLPDLELWLHPTVGVLTDGASEFDGATEFLSIANNAEIAGAATGWWRAIVVNLDTVPSATGLVYPFSMREANKGYYAYIDIDDKIVFIVDSAGGATAVQHGTALVAATDYIIYIYFDGTNIGININDGTPVTGAATFTPGTAGLFLGARDAVPQGPLDGHLQHWIGGDGTLTAAQQTWLVNGGAGRHHGEVGSHANAITTANLKFWNPLNEVSGQRNDQIGTNHLTDNATVTSAAGLVEGPAVNNSPASTWQDQSGNGNDATQNDNTQKPPWLTGQINGQPALDFDDAVNHCLSLTGMTVAAGDLTIIAVVNPDDLNPAGDQYLFDCLDGRLILTHAKAGVDPDETAYYSGAWRGTKAGTAAAQVLTFVMKAANSGAIYRDAAALDTGLAYTAVAIGNSGGTHIGSRHDGSANENYSGLLSELLIYSRALSTAELASIHNYFAKYGTI